MQCEGAHCPTGNNDSRDGKKTNPEKLQHSDFLDKTSSLPINDLLCIAEQTNRLGDLLISATVSVSPTMSM